MDKKNINLNNLEKFLEKAKNKLNDGIEEIGENNMNKLEGFLFDIKKEKADNNMNKEISQKIINFDINKEVIEDCCFEIEYKKDLLNQIINISDESPFNININSDNINDEKNK